MSPIQNARVYLAGVPTGEPTTGVPIRLELMNDKDGIPSLAPISSMT